MPGLPERRNLPPYVSISSGPCPRLMQLTARLPLDFVDGTPPGPCSAKLTKATLNASWTTGTSSSTGRTRSRFNLHAPRRIEARFSKPSNFWSSRIEPRTKGHRRLSFFEIACPPPASAVEKRLRPPDMVRSQKWVVWVSRPSPEDFFEFGLSSLPPTSLGYPLFAEPSSSNGMHP